MQKIHMETERSDLCKLKPQDEMMVKGPTSFLSSFLARRSGWVRSGVRVQQGLQRISKGWKVDLYKGLEDGEGKHKSHS